MDETKIAPMVFTTVHENGGAFAIMAEPAYDELRCLGSKIPLSKVESNSNTLKL